MASSFALTLLLPNARRVNVKVTPNTTILQVLEDVCKKQGLNPIEYDLTHHNKIVELGNSLRFSGIPNNGTLEMVQSTKTRTESPINLGLQLESGKRLMNPFFPHQTLWEVLEHWSKQGEIVFPEANNAEDIQPVCIYMRQEVIGQEQLQTKTLRALGLTQGSAMIRLIHRSVSQLRHQANVSAPLSRVSVAQEDEEKRKEKPTQAKNTSSQTFSSNSTSSSSQASTLEPMDLSPAESNNTSVNVPLITVNKESPPTQRKQLDNTPGYTLANYKKDEEVLPSSSSNSQKPSSNEQEPKLPVFNNAQRFSKEGDFHILGDRDAILYHGDDVLLHPSRESLTDDFFEVTISDVRKMYRDLQSKRKEMEETPLQTKSNRELEKDTTTLRLLHDHPHTVVRIRFSNRYVLQGTFRTADTIETIITWVKQFLSNPQLTFYLFTTPPKKTLELETRLVEEGLVGMAVMYFGSEDPSSPLDQSVLKPELYTKVSAPDVAFDFIQKKLRKEKRDRILGVPGVDDDDSSDVSTDLGKPTSSKDQEETQPQRPPRQSVPQPKPAGGGNVPKWFKTGK